MINIRRRKGKSLENVVESTAPRSILSKIAWPTLFIISSLLGLSTAIKISKSNQGNTEEYIDAIYYSKLDIECRQFGVNNTGQCLRPNVKVGILEVNSDGVWGQEVMPKPENVYRIGCFGASTTAGYRSIDNIDAWPEHLQDIMNEQYRSVKYHVINFGVASTSSRFSLARFLKFSKKYELDMMIFDCGQLWGVRCDAVGEKNYELFEKFLFSGNASLLSTQPWLRQNLDYWQWQREERIRELLRFSPVKNFLDDRDIFSEVNSSYLKCYQDSKKKKNAVDKNRCKVDEDLFIRKSKNKPSVFGNVPIGMTITAEYSRNVIKMVTYALDNNIKPVLLLNLMGDRCLSENTEAFREHYHKCNAYDLTPAEWSAHMNGPVKRTMEYIGSNYNIPVVNPFRGLKKEEICKKFSPVDFMHLTNEGYKELAKTLIPAVVDASKSKSGGN